jgi:hypothetical protein
MNDQKRHEMHLEVTYSTGVEEWCCPTCGRKILMQWPPHYNKVVLEPGNEFAIHVAGKGGLRMGAIQMSHDEDTEPADDLSLNLWEEWLANVDLDSKAQ